MLKLFIKVSIDQIWVEKDSEVHNRSTKSWLQDNDIEKYGTQKEKRSFVAEKFISTLTLFRMGIFGHTYPTMINLAQVYLNLRRSKKHINHVT